LMISQTGIYQIFPQILRSVNSWGSCIFNLVVFNFLLIFRLPVKKEQASVKIVFSEMNNYTFQRLCVYGLFFEYPKKSSIEDNDFNSLFSSLLSKYIGNKVLHSFVQSTFVMFCVD
jgi:hypothetical protein